MFCNFQYLNQFGFVSPLIWDIVHFYSIFLSCSISHLCLFWLPDKTVCEVKLQDDFSRLSMTSEISHSHLLEHLKNHITLSIITT